MLTIQQGYTATSSSGGMTLVGTITTTSGTTQSLTSIATSYKHLLLVFNAVSHNSGSNQSFRVALSSNNGSSYGTAMDVTSAIAAAAARSGMVWVFDTGASSTEKVLSSSVGTATSGESRAPVETVVTGLIDAIQVSPSGGSFDAGSIRVYGVS